MQTRLFKNPFKEQSLAATALNEFSSKKNSQYFITRLKGAILKQCSTYENKCNYKELKGALKQVKAVFIDEKNVRELKNIFEKNDNSIRINDIIQSVLYEGLNISTEAVIVSIPSNQNTFNYYKYIKTEGDEISQYDASKRQKTPQALQQSNSHMNRSFLTHANGFQNSSSRSPTHYPYNHTNYVDVQQPSVFNLDQENQNEFKKIRLPRPKNLRNGKLLTKKMKQI